MKKIILHAGLPKTGSTFLQDFIFPGLDKSLCEYNPEKITKLLIEISKETISGASFSESRIKELTLQINESLRSIRSPTLLISVEGLMPIQCGGYEKADNILQTVKIFFPHAEIIIFLREQVKWIRSAYSFCLVSKYIMTFDEFINRDSAGNLGLRSHDGLNISVYDYEFEKTKSIIDKYFKVKYFFRFEDIFIEGDNKILKKLSKILDVDSLDLSTQQFSNKGLNEDLMVLISSIVSKIPFRSRWKPAYLYTKYSKIKNTENLKYLYTRYTGRFAKYISELLYRLIPRNYSKLFSAQEEERIRDYYLESNKNFWASNDSSD